MKMRLTAQQRTAALKQKDYNKRESGKQLLAQLEALLPPQFRSQATRNGAGDARSVGGNGRAMNDVIKDVTDYVAHRKNAVQPSPARVVRQKSEITRGAQAERQSDTVDILSVSREAMLSAQSPGMFCIEVSMTEEQVCVCVC